MCFDGHRTVICCELSLLLFSALNAPIICRVRFASMLSKQHMLRLYNMCLKFSALPVFCHLQDKAELIQQTSSMTRQMDEAEKWSAPGGSSTGGSDTQELSVQLQQVKEQLAVSQRNAQTWMDASLQCQTELDESAEQVEDAQQHVQILQGRLDQEERRWAQLSHRLTIPTVHLVSHSS